MQLIKWKGSQTVNEPTGINFVFTEQGHSMFEGISKVKKVILWMMQQTEEHFFVLCLFSQLPIFHFLKAMHVYGGSANQNVSHNLLILFYLSFFFMPFSPSLFPSRPSSLYLFAEIPRAVPWQQNDSHPPGLTGRELSHHHVHLLLSLQLQWCRNQIHLDVWPTVSCFHAQERLAAAPCSTTHISVSLSCSCSAQMCSI